MSPPGEASAAQAPMQFMSDANRSRNGMPMLPGEYSDLRSTAADAISHADDASLAERHRGNR
jgi:hypothetical protein